MRHRRRSLPTFYRNSMPAIDFATSLHDQDNDQELGQSLLQQRLGVPHVIQSLPTPLTLVHDVSYGLQWATDVNNVRSWDDGTIKVTITLKEPLTVFQIWEHLVSYFVRELRCQMLLEELDGKNMFVFEHVS